MLNYSVAELRFYRKNPVLCLAKICIFRYLQSNGNTKPLIYNEK